MAKFRKEGKKEVPQVSTSSLPDIVYMLIFFFMITTTMRDVELKVKASPLPKATEIQKLEHKALVSSIYIGAPRDSKLGTESRIQLDDSFATPADIADWIQKERDSRNPADIPLLTTALKVHKDTRMGVVTDVKQELRKVGAFRINYTTLKGSALEN
ncbi:MAG: biopolymer transporter ExbD [Bacteroidales bacterium]|jgi:biopolymer transport protein ExbD|nr:biopolymer transporter ExbD [Bacteroidales bacterium]